MSRIGKFLLVSLVSYSVVLLVSKLFLENGEFVINRGVVLGIFNLQETSLLFLVFILFLIYSFFQIRKVEEMTVPLAVIAGSSFRIVQERILYSGAVDYINISGILTVNIADIAITCALGFIMYLEVKSYYAKNRNNI